MIRTKAILITVLWAFLSALPTRAAQAPQALMMKLEAVPVYQPHTLPIERGEKEVYRATWNGMFSVAIAEVQTTHTVVDGKKVINLRIDAKTSRALDLIWKMRDVIQSTFDAKTLAPVHYNFSQRENSRVIDTEAKYDANTKNWKVYRTQVGHRTRDYQFESNNTLDPISAIYLARSIDFKVGDRLYFKLFGGRYRYLLELFIEKKEMVELESGKSIEAFRILPRVQNTTKKGYAGRLNEAVIWISADERRLPVKLSSKIVFGTVYLDLIQDQRAIEATTAAEVKRPAS